MSTTVVTKRATTTSALLPRASFVKRHPVASYYALAFAISWGGILLVVGGPRGFPGTQADIDRLMPYAIPFMLFGPATAGLAMTALVEGRRGFGELFRRLTRWRVGAGWYALALLTAPLTYAAFVFGMSLVSPGFVPAIVTASDKTSFLLTGLAAALMVGVFEELGWTGFAIPQLRLRHGVVATGLIAGMLWGAWHILTNDVWAAEVISGGLPLPFVILVNGLTMLVGQLLAFRLLMVWAYDRTGSLLLAMLMHFSLTASTFILGPANISGIPLLIYGSGVGAVMWIVVGAFAVIRRQIASSPASTGF